MLVNDLGYRLSCLRCRLIKLVNLIFLEMSFDLFLIFFFLHATFSNSVFQTKIQSFYTKQLRSTYLTSELSLNIASRKCRRKKPRWATTIFRLRPQCYLLTHCQWIVVGVQIEQNPLPGHLMRNFLLIFVLLVGYLRVFFSEGLAFFYRCGAAVVKIIRIKS